KRSAHEYLRTRNFMCGLTYAKPHRWKGIYINATNFLAKFHFLLRHSHVGPISVIGARVAPEVFSEADMPSESNPRPRKRRMRRLFIMFIAFVVLAPVVLVAWWGPLAKPRHCDVIMVPGAALRKGGRELSPVLQSRVDQAISLWRSGYAPKLLFSGGGEGSDNEAEAMARYAIRQGVHPQAILLEKAATTTRSNAEHSAALMKREGLNSALVVSNWYHVARVRLSLLQAGIEASGVSADRPGDLDKEAEALGREWFGLWAYAVKADRWRD
ncbi:MAG: YdcF family protein, partial [Planctomycetes bacterium]|nr:YdcF family protein [Planctomycetota bacterium]